MLACDWLIYQEANAYIVSKYLEANAVLEKMPKTSQTQQKASNFQNTVNNAFDSTKSKLKSKSWLNTQPESRADRLRELKQLLDEGVIDENEFREAKRKELDL